MNINRLAKFYKKQDVIISPSHFETYGYVPLEAIATGTPALINKTLGIKEVFKKLGLDDYIVDFKKPNSIIKKIDFIRKNRLVINKEASRRLRKEYSFSKTMVQFFDTFEKVISRNT
jgi:glycosyltransferase involved in cell wall biosynthesis